MTGHFRDDHVAPLVGRTIPYIWVDSLETAKAAYARTAETVTTRAGTREAPVEEDGHWAILAETVTG